MTCVKFYFTFSISRNKDCARESDVASMIPIKASVWWRRASIASIYPLGGPRFRDGPRKVQAVAFNEYLVWYYGIQKIKIKMDSKYSNTKILERCGGTTLWSIASRVYSRVPSIAQLLHSSLGPERSHLHLDLRHWSQAKVIKGFNINRN